MSTVTLRQALGVLAKSSSFSVKTTSDRPRDVYDDLKDYLYVKSDIERDFEKCLGALMESGRNREILTDGTVGPFHGDDGVVAQINRRRFIPPAPNGS